jgi:hypothetical protein
VGFPNEPVRNYSRIICLSISLIVATVARPAVSHAVTPPTATPPYTVTLFAANPTGLSAPDSVTFNATNVFVGYGNGGNPDGSGGAMSNIVEYDMTGKMVDNITIAGHNDGLVINPATGALWALQNEDSNATLIIITLKAGKLTGGKQILYTIGTGPHGGGYDDIVFDGKSVFFSASNPKVPDTQAAIASAKVVGKKITLTGILNGTANATDVTDGDTVALNLTDPDSMILDPAGELVMTSQGDGELIVVRHPGLSCQKSFVVPLTSTLGGDTIGNTQADDTIFATETAGQIIVADKGLGVFSITAPYFGPGVAYSAIDVYTDPTATTKIGAFVGKTDLTTGFVTPIVNNLTNPGGMAFIPTEGETDRHQPVPDEEAGECP